jgi:glucan phosphoethanolaminetransferase (alkaline phosphatase superfamily)
MKGLGEMTPKMKQILIFFQLVIGLGWVIGLTWVFVAILAAAEPVSVPRVLSYWGGMLVGPIALVIGSISLVGTSRHPRRAGWLAIIGSVAVSIQSLMWVVPSVGESLARNDSGLAALAAVIVGLSLLSSLSAYVTTRDERSAGKPVVGG